MNTLLFSRFSWAFYPAVFLAYLAVTWARFAGFPYRFTALPSAPNTGHLAKYFFGEDKLSAGIQELDASLLQEKRPDERGHIRHNIGVLYIKRYKQNNAPALLDTAVSCFHAAIQDNPRIPQSYYNLGRVNTELGKFEAAAEWYRQAVATDPRYSLALYNLGYFYFEEKKNLDSARLYVERALDCSRRLPLANYLLGSIAQTQVRYPDALRYYTAEVAINPDFPLTYSKLGELYSKQIKDPDKARWAWAKYQELSPKKSPGKK